MTEMRTISSERDGVGRKGKERDWERREGGKVKERDGEGRGGKKSEGEGWGGKRWEEKGRRRMGRKGARKDSVPVQNKQKTKQNKSNNPQAHGMSA